MPTDNLHRVQAIFEAAAELPADQRETFIRRECTGDENLCRQVLALLEADGEPHSVFDGFAIDAIGAELGSTYQGKRIGPYQLVREIGFGGMGTVYLAERTQGDFQQRAAIKLLRPGMASQHLLDRFQRERQILARLQHPNIARLLDGGLTEDGMPYFAMEYVEGEPLDTYCDARRLSIPERLGLFQTVCSAVQYAHQSLLVHRDIKPGNILVDERGDVKLLDFGIAKLLAEQEEETPVLTRTGLRVMTPEYASPEQVRGELVTTASDVYSLGVLLYELLCGRRPYDLAQASPGEMERQICEQEPRKPSTTFRAGVSTERQTDEAQSRIEKISLARGSERERLKRQLSGDLDNICLMALEKTPARRYGSAEQLSGDISRYLSGMPVSARPATWMYSSAKFVRRHRPAVASALTALLLTIALVVFYTSRLARERDRAQLSARKSEQVAHFLTDLFEVADPSTSKGQTVTARELLERGAQRLENGLTDQPIVQSDLLTVIGGVYFNLGLYEDARQAYEKALRLGQDLPTMPRQQRARTLRDLASVMLNTDNYAAAESLATLALGMVGGQANHDAVDAATLTTLGSIKQRQGNYAAADSVFKIALEIQLRETPDDAINLSLTYAGLALIQNNLRDYDLAERYDRKVVVLDSIAHGTESQQFAHALNNLAQVLRRKGDLQAAEPLYRRALALRRRLLGNEHPDVAHTLNHLARLLYFKKEYPEAESMARKGLALRQKIFGDTHVEVVASTGALASILRAAGKIAEAEKLYLRNYDTLHKIVEHEHPYIASMAGNVALAQAALGKNKSAERFFRESLALHKKLYPANNPNIAPPLTGLGALLMRTGRSEQADSLLSEAVALLQGPLPGHESKLFKAESLLGECLTRQQKFEAAETHLLASYQLQQKMAADSEPLFAETAKRLETLYVAWSKPEQARRYAHATSK